MRTKKDKIYRSTIVLLLCMVACLLIWMFMWEEVDRVRIPKPSQFSA